jgi:hypothetical protein
MRGKLIEGHENHPYAEAVYRVVELPGGGFGVEVKIPDSNPTTTTVSRFDTETAAEACLRNTFPPKDFTQPPSTRASRNGRDAAWCRTSFRRSLMWAYPSYLP